MTYAIPDEPSPSRFDHLVVRPSGPLLASMLCGAWLAWPWFVFNGHAMGSPTRKKELAMCAAGLVGSGVLALALILLWRARIITSPTIIEIGLLVITVWKIGMAYAVFALQSRTFHVYTYYGGAVRAATYILAAGFWLRPLIVGHFDDPLWIIILQGGW